MGGDDGYGVLRKPWSDSVSAVRDEAELPIATAIGDFCPQYYSLLGWGGGGGGDPNSQVWSVQSQTNRWGDEGERSFRARRYPLSCVHSRQLSTSKGMDFLLQNNSEGASIKEKLNKKATMRKSKVRIFTHKNNKCNSKTAQTADQWTSHSDGEEVLNPNCNWMPRAPIPIQQPVYARHKYI